MRKYKILFIVLLIILMNDWLQAQTITMRIADTTMVAGTVIDLPIYADNSLTGKNVTAYTLQLSFNQYYFQPIDVIVAGTVSAPYGAPAFNTSIPGKITIANAGSTSLTGIGKFISIRFKALQPGGSWISFTGPQYNFFNEGTPAVSLDDGYIDITTPPSITVYPDNGIITKGEQLQFYVSGGATPFQWFVTNQAVANINASGLLTGTQSGFTKVIAQDINGLINTTKLVEIRAMRLSIPSNLSHLQGTDIDVPVNTTDLTGLNINSGSFAITFNQNILTPIGIVQTGTLLASWPLPEFNLNTPGYFSLAFAGSELLTGNGTLVYVRFHVSSQNAGATGINFASGLFNETLLPTFTHGYFNTINLPVLSISPNTGEMIAGETRQLTVNGGGIPPFTWSINNTDAASIDQTGLMTAKKSGVVKVTVDDSFGANASSGNFQIYDTRIIMPDTVACPESTIFYYPILIGSLPSGESVSSIQATINYDATYLTFLDIETTGTHTQGWTYEKNTSAGQLVLAGSGTTSFNSTGTILKVKFNISSNFTLGSNAFIYLNHVTLNEGIPLPLVDSYGTITGANPGPAGTITGTATVCHGQNNVSYSVPEIAYATGYVWTLPAGATIATGNNTNSITVNYSNTAISGNIKVYGTNGCGNGPVSPNFDVLVNPLPASAGIISGTTTVCQGQNSVIYTVPIIANATSSIIWTLPAGATGTSTTNSITVNYGASAVSGNITVKGNNSCGDGGASTLAITVNTLPASAGPISGTTTVCQGQNSVSYTVAAIANAASYIWTLPTGVTGTSTTNSITVNYGSSAVSGNITVKGNNSCGDGSASTLAITVNSLPVGAGTISGSTTICQGQNSVAYTVPAIANATTYVWTLPTGATGTSTTNSITVNYGTSAVSGNITVKGNNSCGDGTTSTLAITVNPLPASAGTISGFETVCQGQNSVSYTVPTIANATSYIWTLPAGASGTSTTNSITVNYGSSAVSGNITVKGNNSCGDGSASTLAITVNSLPVGAGTILGTTTICQGQNSVTYTVPAISNATTYVWTLPTGATGTSTTNSITVNYGTSAVSGNITVKGNNSCGDGSASSLAITVNPLPVGAGTISGTTTVCQGQNSVTYTVPTITNATTYVWTLPTGATGTSTTNSITVNYGTSAVSSNITVKGNNSCGDGATSTLAITVNTLPASAGTISGTTTVCQGQNSVTYTVPTITNATTYVWTLPTGATGISTTNSITVNYGTSAVSSNITVKGNNSCGDGATSTLAITVNTLPVGAGTISGTATVCQGQNPVTYTVPAITNATTYIWTLPTGATGTSTTNNITVNYGTSAVSGNITVKGNNSCGDGSVSSLAITVNPLPVGAGTISGTATVCQGQNSVTYTVPAIANATTYIWTLPTGATGTSNTNSITVNYGTSAVSGNITVKGNNSCGDGSASSLAITVNPLPVGAGTISGTTTVCQGQNSVTYTVPTITNATTYVWTLPTGATGTSTTNSITVNYGTSAVSGNITVKGNNSCGDGSVSSLAITVNPLPVGAGTISGTATVCQGQNPVTYTVPAITNATTYIWTLPTGATGTSTTNSITVNYGTSAVSGNITVKGNNSCGDGSASTLAIIVSSSCLTHFTPVWTGNGLDHMNINIYSAKLDGVELETGDEIGIFDGARCVGVGILTGTITQLNTLNIAVSRNDGSGNGYTSGNSISYKLYDKSKDLEMNNVTAIYSNTDPSWSTDGKFAIGATAFAELSGLTKINQDITLNTGWNIISANVIPANLNLKDLFQTLIDAGKLKKVMDEAGKTIENFGAFGGWKNNIGNLNSAKGYKVNVLSNSTLSLEGPPVSLPLDIALATGWNIISYPSSTAQDAKALVQSLIDGGKLKKVMDEAGKTIENFGAFGGWKNNIGNFLPGKGYKVNVLENCTLTIPATANKAATIIQEVLASTHFTKAFTGNGTDHASINLVNLQGSGLQAGDEIGVFDGKLCVGSATISSEQLMDGSISIPASANDELAETVNGFTSGHPIELKLFRGTQTHKLNLVKLSGNELYEKNGSLFAQANTNDLTTIQITDGSAQFKCYPNPFTSEITIEVQNLSQAEITVEIYNLAGQRIKNLFKGTNPGNLVVKWNGTSDSDQQVVPGVYLCKVNGQSKQVIFEGEKRK